MTVEDSEPMPPVAITMTQSLWRAWATIAERHAVSARVARESDADDRLYVEFCDGVVAISAVAMCCEALQRQLQNVAPVPAPSASNGNKVRAIDCLTAALHTAIGLPSSDVQRLIDDVNPYYDKRNAVAHFSELGQAPVPHPAGGNTSVETFDYRVEEAETALAAVHAIFEALRDHPSRGFESWSEAHAHALSGQSRPGRDTE